MTDNFADTGDDEPQDSVVTLKRSDIRALEKKARERDEFARQAEQAGRRLAFAEAGLPLGDKRISYFIKGYEGDLDTDSILAAAEEAGFLDSAPRKQLPGQTTVDQQVEQRTLQAIYSASQGAGTPQPGDMEAAMERAMQEGGADGLLQYLQSQGVAISED